MADITPMQHRIDSKDGSNVADDYVKISPGGTGGTEYTLHKPFCFSLPTNHDFNSFLASRSIRSANKYIVTRVVECATVGKSMCSQLIHVSHLTFDTGLDCRSPAKFKNPNTPLCIIAKPLVWHRDGPV